MVYDGNWLKFYRNGYLMSKVAASGNLIQNNYKTMIGEFAGYPAANPEAFVGFIDEVRIWNTARTQSEIQSFMNGSLPNPTSQLGLLAYYSFNSLTNLQGNSNWDGILTGNATIQRSNPTCNNFTMDSCEIYALPTITKSNDTSVCIGKPALLIANATNAYSYQWTPQVGLSNSTISNPIATPLVTTKYYITINAKDSRGVNITLNDSIIVKVIQKPIFSLIPLSGNICLGDSILLSASGGNIYQWKQTPDIQNKYSPTVWVKPNVSSNYTVIILENVCGFVDSLQTSITLNKLPIITISKNNDIDCSNSSSNLIATGGNAYNWTPTNGLSNSSISNPTVQINQTTTYVVKVTSVNNCIAVDSITVYVSNRNQSSYFIPNSFTPNKDGLNDTFGIKDWGYTTKFYFTIYNRWGELIFFSSDPLKRWDGNIKGIPQDSGVFIYYIKAETLCGTVERNGTVLLIR
jgi:gliding motility-associated-like protein